MTDFIKNLQNKPDSFKRVVMWFSVFFVMAAIFIFWFLNFPSSVSVPENSEAALNSDTLAGASIPWRQGLNKELPDVWQSLKEQLSNLGNLWQK